MKAELKTQPDKTDIVNYIFFVILKRKFLLITVGIFTFISVVFFTFLVTPTWEGITKVLVERSSKQSLGIFKDVNVPVSSAGLTGHEASSMLSILAGENMAYDIAKEFNLDELSKKKRLNPRNFREKAKNIMVDIMLSPVTLLQKLGLLKKGEKNWLDKAAEDFLKDWQDIKVEMDSGGIELAISAERPALAMDIANRMVELLKERTQSFTREGAKSTYAFLKNQILVAEENLRMTEDELVRFKKENGIVVLEEEKRLNVSKLKELESDLLSIDKQKKEVKTLLSQVKRGFDDQEESLEISTIITRNPVVSVLETSLKNQEMKLASLLIEKQITHPEVQMLMAEIRKSTKVLRDTVLLDLKTELLTLTAREDVLKDIIKEHEEVLKSIPEKELKLARLQETLAIRTSVYQSLKTRFEEMVIEKESMVNEYNIRVLDRAYISGSAKHDWPKWSLSIIAAIVFSITFGFGSIFLIEYWNDSITDSSKIEKDFSVPCIGIVPKYRNRIML